MKVPGEAAVSRLVPGEPVVRDLRQESGADATTVKRLLTDAGLPLDGLQDTALVVAEVGKHGVVGAAGYELHGPFALLRSVVVRPDFRLRGLRKLLVEAAIGRARAAGATRVYLLTDPAEGYYTRIGFRKVARAETPAQINELAEVRGACPVSAVAMVLE